MELKFIEFQIHGDARGQLIALEENINIPFSIKRVYFMYDTKKDVHRGLHAHKKSCSRFYFVCRGRVQSDLMMEEKKVEVKLNRPEKKVCI